MPCQQILLNWGNVNPLKQPSGIRVPVQVFGEGNHLKSVSLIFPSLLSVPRLACEQFSLCEFVVGSSAVLESYLKGNNAVLAVF